MPYTLLAENTGNSKQAASLLFSITFEEKLWFASHCKNNWRKTFFMLCVTQISLTIPHMNRYFLLLFWGSGQKLDANKKYAPQQSFPERFCLNNIRVPNKNKKTKANQPNSFFWVNQGQEGPLQRLLHCFSLPLWLVRQCVPAERGTSGRILQLLCQRESLHSPCIGWHPEWEAGQDSGLQRLHDPTIACKWEGDEAVTMVGLHCVGVEFPFSTPAF